MDNTPKKVSSIHEMLNSKCIVFKDNSRVFQIAQAANQDGDIVIYTDDELFGYIKARNKGNFIIEFRQKGFLFKANAKYSDVIAYGEKLPREKNGQVSLDRFIRG